MSKSQKCIKCSKRIPHLSRVPDSDRYCESCARQAVKDLWKGTVVNSMNEERKMIAIDGPTLVEMAEMLEDGAGYAEIVSKFPNASWRELTALIDGWDA